MRAKHLLCAAVLAAFVLSFSAGFSLELKCANPCVAGSQCACSIPSCQSGTLVVTDATNSPIGAYPISVGSSAWTPSAVGSYSLQANCGGDLSSVFPVSVFSISLDCGGSCRKGSPCSCSVQSCQSGTLVVTDATNSPIGAYPVTDGSVSWTPSKDGKYSLQANCGGYLSSVASLSLGEPQAAPKPGFWQGFIAWITGLFSGK